METLVTILHVMVCIFLMLTVLLQAGKGGGMGAAFGGGSSMGTVFGGSGAGNFLRRLTVAAAIIFMITSMTLAWMATPTVDPIKEYWAEQNASMTERDRAHKAAIEQQKGKSEGAQKASPTQNPATPGQGGATGAAPATGAPAADPGTGEDKAGASDDKAGADTSAADKAGASDDKAGADKPVEDKPVEDKPVEDKPVEDKPVEDKPASGSQPAEPAKSSDSTP
jgi:preprotein translocase subunit SecG